MLSKFIESLTPLQRILIIVLILAGAFVVNRILRFIGRLYIPRSTGLKGLAGGHPKLATLGSLALSIITFAIFFAAFGLILKELGISLTAYLASASVIGLAIGFGSQGIVQDVVTGITLIFSNVINVGDFVEISGEVGRVEELGMRFTRIMNIYGEIVYVPNRIISQISRYRSGYFHAFVDVELPGGANQEEFVSNIETIAGGVQVQYSSIILAKPELIGVFIASPGDWRYMRLKFALWPGQGDILLNVFKPRLLSSVRRDHPDYADWMINISYGAVES